jgi:hypothetical protein
MSHYNRLTVIRAFWSQIQTNDLPGLRSSQRPGTLGQDRVRLLIQEVGGKLDLPGPARVLLEATTLLFHDHWDQAHDLVGDLTDPDAAWIHGILHRREPDYWNAKYWFRRCDMHPGFNRLHAEIRNWPPESDGEIIRRLTLPGSFDPFAFVDAVEASETHRQHTESAEFLKKIQQAEFEALMQHLLA